MSNYFNKVPNFKYTNLLKQRGINDKTQVKNLFRRAKLRDDIFENLSYFDRYIIIGDERPDQVAFKLYDDPNLDWIILVTNNILNLQSEWPLPQRIFNDYLLEKYGSYEEIYATHHFESREVYNSRNELMYPAGLVVSENHKVEFYDPYLDKRSYTTDTINRITNYVYEERLESKKRQIYILKSEYISQVDEDIKEIMTYKQGSTEYVSRTLKDTEDLFEK